MSEINRTTSALHHGISQAKTPLIVSAAPAFPGAARPTKAGQPCCLSGLALLLLLEKLGVLPHAKQWTISASLAGAVVASHASTLIDGRLRAPRPLPSGEISKETGQ